MSDNPLIKAFIKLHEGGGALEEKVGPRPNQPASTTSSAEGLAMGRGAVNNITMGAGKYGRAAVDYGVKNLGSLAGMSEPTTFDKELEQEKEKDTAAQRDYPAAYDMGDKLATAAQLATGVGAVKVLGKEALKTGLRSAVAKNASQTIAKNADANDFELGMRNALDLTKQMRVPRPTLKLTQQMRTEEQTDPSKGNTEMSTNPFIKGFFDIEEARAKNTNIFDESKKLTAAQKKNLDKNDNDKIDAEDFKMLRKKSYNEQATPRMTADQVKAASKGGSPNPTAQKEFDDTVAGAEQKVDASKFLIKQGLKYAGKSVGGPIGGLIGSALGSIANKKMYNEEETIEEAESYTHRVGGYYTHRGDDKPVSVKVNASSEKEAKEKASAQLSANHKNYRPTTVKQITNEEADLDEAKKTNSMVMARNISKVLKAAKPDFLDIDKDGDKEEPMKKAAADMKKEEVEFSEEEIDFINSVMEAMPVAPTSENDSPNPTPKKKAEGSRAKGSMAD